MVKDINPDLNAVGRSDLTSVNGVLYFEANDGVRLNGWFFFRHGRIRRASRWRCWSATATAAM